ncbi:hypothetical protein HNO88_003802 [Novosphingobium chloroacetimidivorans]|uniref:Uncharacterized protein n=1 Tax=Novosphingobium chloroacetimidivorans TaxID=1428314 RepID=A0A7W7KCS9_9SPHN|nr:hypothetical protein [Novosphingobium chloroacetimidivorans]
MNTVSPNLVIPAQGGIPLLAVERPAPEDERSPRLRGGDEGGAS